MQISRGITAHKPPLFLLITGAITAVAIVIPLTYLVIRTAGVGIEELADLLLRPRTVTVLINSAGMAAGVTLFSALIAIPLAFLTVRTDLPWRRFWLIVTTLPLAVPSYVGSFALIAAFGPRGSLLQLLLEPLGVQELPSIYGWFGTILAITLFTYPYILLSVRAGLHGIDPAMEEAALSLGYSKRATFFRVILPQLRPSIVAGSLLVALYALRDFGTPSLMRFDAFTRVIFLQYRSSFNRNLAAALALVLVVLVLGILWLENKARSRARYYSRRASRRTSQVKLGYWKLPALLFCTAITLIGLVLPVGVALFWLIRGLSVGGGDAVNLAQDMVQPALNSIWASVLAAIAATICALPVAILAVRFPSRITAIIERCSYIGFGLPGIVVALSLVFLGANYLPWIYQTVPILVFAYLVLFLPQSVGTVRSSLLQVNPQLEESAQVLGRTPWQTLREITLPLVRPGILSGSMLVFLTAIKELPATLLLAPIGFSTLATKIWTATENVAFSDAAAAALTMLLVSFGSTLFMLSQEQ
ncbi:iron ABC transporter permease [Gloeocapsopsis sp. IPPAS B-1203]|uniref:ABC transporter permease n=1 Tax=Gloeocapsopsis sp. IPPAS B-1203 TaxID=2049454 RepID=UPI000C195C6A|nr:iron ABC transporter permease [Gloeocapsopsis sp. IPPAS B-1203]PIG92544.1 iron ABC transporter permease [Gloeocapsopsis sp. IPPAS B-1203]